MSKKNQIKDFPQNSRRGNRVVMEVSSVSPRVPPGQLRSGMIFCAKSPTLGDKLLSNFPRGRGGAIGRGLFSCKGSGSVYRKWSLASPTD